MKLNEHIFFNFYSIKAAGKESLTSEVPQMAHEQRVWTREGNDLRLFHSAHGQLCVR